MVTEIQNKEAKERITGLLTDYLESVSGVSNIEYACGVEIFFTISFLSETNIKDELNKYIDSLLSGDWKYSHAHDKAWRMNGYRSCVVLYISHERWRKFWENRAKFENFLKMCLTTIKFTAPDFCKY